MSEINCPQCQATMKEVAKFCHVCGYKVPEENSQIPRDEEVDMKTFTDVNSSEVISGIKSGNIFKRAINIMFKPKSEWEVVAKETPKVPMLVFGYALIFSIIPFISLIIGYGLVGRRISFLGYSHWETNFGTGILQSFVFLIAAFTAVIVGAVIINALAPAFKSEKNLGRAMQLTVYSFTPVFFAGVFFSLPFLSVIAHLAGLYGIFVLLMGLPVVMKTPKNNQIGYFFASAGILF
jgi:hypothetical protein